MWVRAFVAACLAPGCSPHCCRGLDPALSLQFPSSRDWCCCAGDTGSLQTAGSITCIWLLLSPTGLCCNCLSVQGILVPLSFASSLRSQMWFLAALARWKRNLEKARTAEVLPCLCNNRRVGMGHCSGCKLEFFTDLSWWNVCLKNFGCYCLRSVNVSFKFVCYVKETGE